MAEVAERVMKVIYRPEINPDVIAQVHAVFSDRKHEMRKLLDDVSTEADEAVR
jgi:hypothetical protein